MSRQLPGSTGQKESPAQVPLDTLNRASYSRKLGSAQLAVCLNVFMVLRPPPRVKANVRGGHRSADTRASGCALHALRYRSSHGRNES